MTLLFIAELCKAYLRHVGGREGRMEDYGGNKGKRKRGTLNPRNKERSETIHVRKSAYPQLVLVS